MKFKDFLNGICYYIFFKTKMINFYGFMLFLTISSYNQALATDNLDPKIKNRIDLVAKTLKLEDIQVNCYKCRKRIPAGTGSYCEICK